MSDSNINTYFQKKRRSSLTTDRFSVGCQKTANGGSLYTIKRRLIVLFVIYAIVGLYVLVCYVIVVRNHRMTLVAFEQYLSCALSTPQADCIQLFRKYTVSQMMLAADFAVYNVATIGPTIFFFAYKEVRKLWFSIITCGLYSRKKTVPRENVPQFNLNYRNNHIRPVAQVAVGLV